MTMSCGDLPSSLFDDTWYFFHMEAYLLVRRRRFFETPSGRQALPSSLFSATTSVFSDISFVVVREGEPPPQLAAAMMVYCMI